MSVPAPGEAHRIAQVECRMCVVPASGVQSVLRMVCVCVFVCVCVCVCTIVLMLGASVVVMSTLFYGA